jgi:hypothetical protein
MNRRIATVSAILAVVLVSGMAYADDDVTSLSYISYLERYATLQPGQGGETLDAVVNMPVLAGDELNTTRGARVEIQLAEGSTVWVDEFSTLDFDAIANSRDSAAPRTALYLADGTIAVEIPATAIGEGTIRLDSPNGTVNLDRPGLYRVDLQSGQLHVAAFTGLAELPAGVGSELLRTGQEATIGGDGQIETAAMSDQSDDFWDWVQERRQPMPSARTEDVLSANAADHAAVLDNYGEWVWVDTAAAWMWRPYVGAGWSPYSYGRWYWTPVGWNWISYEPWGWYPFHYGSWWWDASFGWVWGWDNVWGPAWVDWIYTPGYIGWCPRGYYDWWWAHNCSHCWGEGWRHPRRWGPVAFNFSGRIRLGEVDARPWTIVPTGQFANPHLERVRLDPRRMRGELGDREGFVRSGQFLTPPPSRGIPERELESFFRGTPGRPGADITGLMSRSPEAFSRLRAPSTLVHPMLTNEMIARTPVRVVGTPQVRHREIPEGGRAVGFEPGRRFESGQVAQGERDVSRRGTPGGAPPTVRREVIAPRNNLRRETSPNQTTPRREFVTPRVRRESGSGIAPRETARPHDAPPRPEPPPSQSRQPHQNMSRTPYAQPRERGEAGYFVRGRAAQREVYSAPTRYRAPSRVESSSQWYRPSSGWARSSTPTGSGSEGRSGGSAGRSAGSGDHASGRGGGRGGRHR